MTKFSKTEVAYTDKGTIEEHCSACVHYIDRKTCAIVHGAIKPGGWCKMFKAHDMARYTRNKRLAKARL